MTSQVDSDGIWIHLRFPLLTPLALHRSSTGYGFIILASVWTLCASQQLFSQITLMIPNLNPALPGQRSATIIAGLRKEQERGSEHTCFDWAPRYRGSMVTGSALKPMLHKRSRSNLRRCTEGAPNLLSAPVTLARRHARVSLFISYPKHSSSGWTSL